jgi:acyl CoA:acetate/3-ketoacid CoA transferase beta subunit
VDKDAKPSLILLDHAPDVSIEEIRKQTQAEFSVKDGVQ